MTNKIGLLIGLLLSGVAYGAQPINGGLITDGTVPLSKLAPQTADTIVCNAAGSAASPTACNAAQAVTAIGDFSTALSTALGGNTPITNASRFAQALNVMDYGAVGDARSFSDGTISASSNSFSSASATFTSANVGKTIQIDGASGGLNPPLITTIASITDSHTVRLMATATATTPSYYIGLPLTTTSGTSGNYVPGDVMSLIGGTHSATGSVIVLSTQVRAANITAAGSGGINGACILTGTTGTAANKFSVNATVSGGAVTALGSIISGGDYVANPPTLSAEPVSSNCLVVGATLSISMGIDVTAINAPGTYSVVPTSPIATTAGATSGATGATLSPFFTTTGTFTYGTDNSQAFVSTANAVITRNTMGVQSYLYAPQGTYYISGAHVMPTFTGVPGGIAGDGSNKTQIILGANYNGDLFSWSDAWLAGSQLVNGATISSQDNITPTVRGITVIGDRLSSFTQNAMMLYDHDDMVVIDDVDVYFLHGRCLATGATKNDSEAYIRESRITRLRCFNDGAANAPVVDLNSTGTGGDATNEIDVENLDIYAPYGPGVLVRDNGANGATRNIKISNLRIEGLSGNPANVQADLLVIGDATETGNVNNIFLDRVELISPYQGQAAFRTAANNAGVMPYLITVDDAVIEGTPLGYGVKIDSGRSLDLHFTDIYSWNTNISVLGNTVVGSPVIFDLGNLQNATTFNIDSTSLASVSLPMVYRQADGTIPLGPVGALHFPKIYGASGFGHAYVGGSDTNSFDLVVGDGATITLRDPAVTTNQPWIMQAGVTGSAEALITGYLPRIQSLDTNDIDFVTNSGAGGGRGGAIQFGVANTTGAVDFLEATGAATGNPATTVIKVATVSSDANVNIDLITKGTGCVQASGACLPPLLGPTGTNVTNAHTVFGTYTLSGGTVNVTFSGAAVFTSSASYVCVANDISGSAVVASVQNTSATQIKISGTGTDGGNYICTGG